MSSASYWMTSLSCSSSYVVTQDGAFGISLVFLSPCLQRALLSTVDVIFLLVVFVFATQKLYSRFTANTSAIDEPLITKNKTLVDTNLWFKLSLLVTFLLAVLSIVSYILARKLKYGIVCLIQAIAFLVNTFLIIHEKKIQVVTHPLFLRVFWVVNFILIALLASSGILRLLSDTRNTISLKSQDIVSLISLPFSVFLLIVSIYGSTGIIVRTESSESLNANGKVSETDNVNEWASASIPSKVFWLWMNPLLKKGNKTPLKLEDIPPLSPEYRAEKISKLFEENWPKPEENSKHPVQITLLRCFWKHIAFTAFLGIVRLCVMYVGPLLIQRFVDFTSGKTSNSPYEGYYLITILLVAKFIEVLSSHHFNFHSQKLGMLIRSTLLTSLYKKGLRLSCSARQSHGVGRIVNYMVVDAQLVGDMILQLHAIWLMPLQVSIGLAILYKYLGLPSVITLVGILVVRFYVILGTKRNNMFQYSIMQNRDSRMKAMNEMLNNMRVIKYQAWEQHFNRRIQAFRESEFRWLTKLMFSVGWNTIVLWSAPLFISSLTFGSAIWLGIPLDPGTVFTATSLFKNLQEPIKTFPRSMISITQASISLRRLDAFLLSNELNEGAVERQDSCNGGSTAVEFKDGSFSWDDEAAEGVVVKNLNFKIKKGELTAIVGTVGSGKSSLLSSVIGEMHKISGKVPLIFIKNHTLDNTINFKIFFFVLML